MGGPAQQMMAAPMQQMQQMMGGPPQQQSPGRGPGCIGDGDGGDKGEGM